MRSIAAPEFWQYYHQLPPEIRTLADKNYKLWVANPRHPSLHFKKVGRGLWSARVGQNYRALALQEGDVFVWTWIGSHDEYEKMISGAK